MWTNETTYWAWRAPPHQKPPEPPTKKRLIRIRASGVRLAIGVVDRYPEGFYTYTRLHRTDPNITRWYHRLQIWLADLIWESL